MDTIVIGGGQSGLASARALRDAGLRCVVLEAGERATGSWPGYYDSLTLISTARFSALPGMAFPGDGDRYPHRDEVAAYVSRYAERLTGRGLDLRTGSRVRAVHATGDGFAVHLADGVLSAPAVVAATGSFANPNLPALPGAGGFTGRVVHAAHYREPAPFAGLRVVVVGGGNSALQIGYELAAVASVSLAVRSPIRFGHPGRFGQRVAFRVLNRVPSWAFPMPFEPVLDDGRFRLSLDLRPMFTRLDGDQVVWADGSRERVDALVLATGYRPDVAYLAPLGALDPAGRPRHVRGLSVTHPGLAYVGLNWQRTPASNSLRGVGVDARYLARKLAAHLRHRPR